MRKPDFLIRKGHGSSKGDVNQASGTQTSWITWESENEVLCIHCFYSQWRMLLRKMALLDFTWSPPPRRRALPLPLSTPGPIKYLDFLTAQGRFNGSVNMPPHCCELGCTIHPLDPGRDYACLMNRLHGAYHNATSSRGSHEMSDLLKYDPKKSEFLGFLKNKKILNKIKLKSSLFYIYKLVLSHAPFGAIKREMASS